jgi:hypothetical protein
VRVRALTGLGNDTIGVALMNNAFGPKGHLTDPARVLYSLALWRSCGIQPDIVR